MTHPLSELLARGIDAQAPVAFGAEGERTFLDLRRDAAALAAELGASAAGTAGRWLLDSEDGYRAAVAIVAAALAGARVSLPPNLQPGTIEELARGCACVLSQEPRSLPVRVLDPLAPGQRAGAETVEKPADAVRHTMLDRDAPLVELFTSGTSGAGKRVTKSLRHLEDEVVTLERELGGRLAPSLPVLASASPRHLYGLLFRVLWPLASARPFLRTSLLMPEELLQQISAAGRPVAVVSTPAHLRHLVANGRLAGVAPLVRAVFSSGGPLEESTARALEEMLGHAPVEIFGSTETGGVAWRQTIASDPRTPWQPMSPVRIETDADSRLVVRSPFVTAPDGESGEPGAWTMGDHVEIVAQGFRLLGRADRVCKIGEKTFSLPAIEAAFVEHEWIDSVSVAPYRSKTGTRLGALAVLKPMGREELARRGRRAVQGVLGDHLARNWDRLALPRRWRFCDALPFDERGKLSLAAVEAALAEPPQPVLGPMLLGQTRAPGALERRLLVPYDLALLEGHYEGFPLVQGVVQIEWVMDALADLLGTAPVPERMEAVKFKDVLRPGQAFTLRVEESGGRASFTLADGERTFSSGRIVLPVPRQSA